MECHVVQERRALVKRHVEAIVQVVVQVGSGGYYPIHEARFHQRNEAGFAQPGRRERAGEAQTDEAVAGKHFFDEQFRGFAEPSAVVSQKSLVDEIGDGDLPADSQRIESGIGGELL